MAPPAATSHPAGLLGDSVARDYGDKLRRFAAFAAPELAQAIAGLRLAPGMRVLDAGCGTGEVLAMLAAQVGPSGLAVGVDLAGAHARAARVACEAAAVLQGNLAQLPLARASFDLVWSLNTINHLRDPLACLLSLAGLLKPRGRLVLGQSSFLPDMYFAWDARLERLTNEAVRAYYRERYGVSERELTGIRALVGLMRRTALQNVAAESILIERVAPLAAADEAYLLETIYRGTWGARLQGHLAEEEREELERLCDPAGAGYAPRRADFHFLQSLTFVSAQRPADG